MEKVHFFIIIILSRAIKILLFSILIYILISNVHIILPIYFIYYCFFIKLNTYFNNSYECLNYIYNKEFCNNLDKNMYDVVIIGDSIANASFLPEFMSDRVINLSLNTATPITIYYALKNILKKINTKYIYISFMDHHFNKENGFFQYVLPSYRLKFIDECCAIKEFFKYNEKSILKNPNILIDWFLLRSGIIFLFTIKKFKCSYVYQNKFKYFIHGGRYIGRQIDYKKDGSINETFDEYKVSYLYDYYFKAIINIIDKRKIRTKIILPPINPAIKQTEKYKTELLNYYKKIEQEFMYVEFVNRWEDFRNEDFCDTHHLNIYGALKFTKRIVDNYTNEFTSRRTNYLYELGRLHYNLIIDHDFSKKNLCEDNFFVRRIKKMYIKMIIKNNFPRIITLFLLNNYSTVIYGDIQTILSSYKLCVSLCKRVSLFLLDRASKNFEINLPIQCIKLDSINIDNRKIFILISDKKYYNYKYINYVKNYFPNGIIIPIDIINKYMDRIYYVNELFSKNCIKNYQTITFTKVSNNVDI